jgi:hypothetical protein
MRRLKKLKKTTREYLLEQMRSWMKVVPSLKDMTWLDDFGEYVDEEQNDERKIYEIDEIFEENSIVYTLVKMVSDIGEVNNDNWIAAITILSCPALLILRAKKIQVIPEFPELDTKWNTEQADQIRRMLVVLKLVEEMKEAEMKIKWISVEKRERENEWKKLFKGAQNTCMKVIKQVQQKNNVKRMKK